MSLRFLAGALGIPFIPTKSGLGSDIITKEGFSPETRRQRKVARKKCLVAENPFSEKEDKVVLLPAANPDVALMHAQYVGEDGTVRIKGLTFADVEQAKSADKVIVTCEEIVPRSVHHASTRTRTHFLLSLWMPSSGCLTAPIPLPVTGFTITIRPISSSIRPWQVRTQDARNISTTGSTASPLTRRTSKRPGLKTLMRIRANPIVGYAAGLDRK